jgi:hypothetical protein
MKHLLPVNPHRSLVTMVAFVAASVAFVSKANAETPPDGEFRTVTTDAKGQRVDDGIVVEVGRNVQPPQVIRAYGAQFKVTTGQDLTWQIIQAKNPGNTFPVCWTQPGHPTYGRRGDTSVWEGCPEAKRGLAFMAGVWGRIVIPAKPVETYAERMQRLADLDACVKDKKCLERKLDALAKGAPAQASPPAPAVKPPPAPLPSVEAPTAPPERPSAPMDATPTRTPSPPSVTQGPFVWIITGAVVMCVALFFLGLWIGLSGKDKALKKQAKKLERDAELRKSLLATEYFKSVDDRKAEHAAEISRLEAKHAEALTAEAKRAERFAAEKTAELSTSFEKTRAALLSEKAKLEAALAGESARIARLVTGFVIPVVERLEEVEAHCDSLLEGGRSVVELEQNLRETEAKLAETWELAFSCALPAMQRLEAAEAKLAEQAAASRATIPDGAIAATRAIEALEQEHKNALARVEEAHKRALAEKDAEWEKRLQEKLEESPPRSARKSARKKTPPPVPVPTPEGLRFAEVWRRRQEISRLASELPDDAAGEAERERLVEEAKSLFAEAREIFPKFTGGLDLLEFLESSPSAQHMYKVPPPPRVPVTLEAGEDPDDEQEKTVVKPRPGAEPPNAASALSPKKVNGTAHATAPLGEEPINYAECLRATAAIYGLLKATRNAWPKRIILNRPTTDVLLEFLCYPAQIAPDLAPSVRPGTNGQQGAPEPVLHGGLAEMVFKAHELSLVRKKTLPPPEGGLLLPLPGRDDT